VAPIDVFSRPRQRNCRSAHLSFIQARGNPAICDRLLLPLRSPLGAVVTHNVDPAATTAFKAKTHLLHLLARQSQMSFDLFLPSKHVVTGIGLDLGTIQRDPLHGNQPLGAQRADHLYKQDL
jgi:hypothetical protein